MAHEYVSFWVAIGLAILVRIITSKKVTLVETLVTAISGFFFAWAYTDGIRSYLDFGEEFIVPIGATLALTGDSIAKAVLAIKSIEDIIRIYREFRDKY